MSTVDDTKDPIPEVMPLIPLRDLVLFPNLVVPLFVGREKSILALEEAMRGDHHVALVAQLLPDTQEPGAADLHVVGCVGTVLQELKLPDGTAKALVEGVARIRIVEYVTTEPYLQVRVETVEEEASSDLETTALMRALVGDFEKAAELGKPIPQEVLMAAGTIEEPGRLADFVAFHLNLRSEEKQVVLEAIEPRDRLDKASMFLHKELQILELGSKIQNRVKESMSASQREYFLREQLKAIQQELGAYDEVQA
ncbi:MAG TPA: LON peptidase substrate-binding domain-containing protein, partial [Coriobacteriia bacterium]